MKRFALIFTCFGFLLFSAAFYFYLTSTKDNAVFLKVHMLNVGQGDAFLIEAPNGKQLLIDGGRPDNKVLSELSRVMRFWDRKIDVVIATHPDADHIGGLAEVIERYNPDLFISSKAGKDTEVVTSLFGAFAASDAEGYFAQAGMRVVLDQEKNIYLDILFPDRDVTTWAANDGSIVAKLSYNEETFLFTGDAEAGVETYLVKENPEALDVDVLKVGHHGSKTSSTEAFLKAVSPAIALLSVGRNNTYGHPSPEVMNRIRALGIETFSTEEDGAVTLVTDGKVMYRKQ